MIKKQFLLAALFSASASIGANATAAELLYQWQEADGSLTFSPTPPPTGSGIDYKVIKSTGEDSASPVLLTRTKPGKTEPAQVARPAQSQLNSLPMMSQQPAEKLAYAPSTSGLSQGITAGISKGTQQGIAAVEPQPGESSAQAVAASTKSRHCGKLRKRITSLEHIMAGARDAQTMDDTVVQITRYQNSFNQHCLR